MFKFTLFSVITDLRDGFKKLEGKEFSEDVVKTFAQLETSALQLAHAASTLAGENTELRTLLKKLGAESK